MPVKASFSSSFPFPSPSARSSGLGSFLPFDDSFSVSEFSVGTLVPSLAGLSFGSDVGSGALSGGGTARGDEAFEAGEGAPGMGGSGARGDLM